MSHTITTPARGRQRAGGAVAFTVLIGLTVLAVLLQGLWAGIFLERDGRRNDAAGWINVHARCGEIALILAAVATVVGVVWLRARRDLWIGAAVLTVLLALEAYLGGAISEGAQVTLTAVHVPLALAIMALAVWLLVRSRRPARAA